MKLTDLPPSQKVFIMIRTLINPGRITQKHTLSTLILRKSTVP